VKKQRILNASEQLTEDVLRYALKGTGYRVFPRLPLAKVLKRDPGERLTTEDKRFLETSEFDFVIADANAIPEFAVEFDGPSHQLDEQRKRDARKNKLCSIAKFPLLRITDIELEEFDKYTILEFIIARFLAWRAESDEIRQEIAEHVSTLDEHQLNALVEGGIADPSIDPTFHFDLRHPFPRTIEVAKRLLYQYQIVSIWAQPLLKSMANPRPYHYFCEVSLPSETNFEGYDLIVRSDYAISRSTEPFSGIKTIANEQDKKTSAVLKQGKVSFRIRQALPIMTDYNPKETPVGYFLRTGDIPISFPELPGVTPSDIAENMSEYLGLREVEKWAEKSLKQDADIPNRQD
jgi:very-short-patch-repair endonuclease